MKTNDHFFTVYKENKDLHFPQVLNLAEEINTSFNQNII